MLRKCSVYDRDYFLKHPVLCNHISLLYKMRQTFSPGDDIFILKAPGRVNLIGEHTDYNMGPVLPCAIDKEIVFCIRPGQKDFIKAVNTDEKFPEVRFQLDQKIEPYARGSWGNYIKAGIKGILDYLQAMPGGVKKQFTGYDIVVSSTLPLAAGVSSSSALVVAAALSFVLANDLDISKQKIAGICARAEHFVGTAGGGMDQAASLLGKKDSFLFMEFNPLRIKDISAPSGLQLVLFNSLVAAEKSGKSRSEYNRRVLECRMALDLFLQFYKAKAGGRDKKINYIGEITAQNFDLKQSDLDKMVEYFLAELSPVYSLEDFSRIILLTEEEMNRRYQAILQGDTIREPEDGFKLKARFKHVYYECRRVFRTADCLQNKNLNDLGLLINQSHNSLSEDYQVSVPEVDHLVNILLDNGAHGARIMGAGFGGMVLAYTEVAEMDHLIEKVKNQYYNKIPHEKNDVIFPCVASDGAGLL